MGTEVLVKTFEGKLSINEARKKLQILIENARGYSGHQEGYSGDWNSTSDRIDHFNEEVFQNYQMAFDHLSSRLNKWEVGVTYFNVNMKKNVLSLTKQNSRRLKKVDDLITALQKELEENQTKCRQLVSAIEQDIAKSDKKIKCEHCQASFKKKYLKNMIDFSCYQIVDSMTTVVKCPLCKEPFKHTIHKDIKKIDKMHQVRPAIKSDINSLFREKDLILTDESEQVVMTIMVGMAAS